MSKAIITEQHLHDIADAIIAKGGATAPMTPAQMAAAIAALPSGDDWRWPDDTESFIAWYKTTSPNTTINIPVKINSDIDWGDGTTSPSSEKAHTYAQPGLYQVTIRGGITIGSLGSIIGITPWVSDGLVANKVALYAVSAGTKCDLGVYGRFCYDAHNLRYVRSMVPVYEVFTNNAAYFLRNCYQLRSFELAEIVYAGQSYTSAGSQNPIYSQNLKEIVLPDGLNYITNYFARSCFACERLIIPRATTHIGNYAFTNCYTLPLLEIPQNVSEIGNGAFDNCYSLSEVRMKPAEPPTLGTGVFTSFNQDNFKIVVPPGCGEAYKAATNWTTYSDYIVEEEA